MGAGYVCSDDHQVSLAGGGGGYVFTDGQGMSRVEGVGMSRVEGWVCLGEEGGYVGGVRWVGIPGPMVYAPPTSTDAYGW